MTKKITPSAMRRTFQDMARAAAIKDVVTRAVSGHATTAMQQHYSTVAQDEIRECIGKVISIAGIRRAKPAAEEKTDQGGVQGGVHEAEKKMAS
jgi:hypothetical protein